MLFRSIDIARIKYLAKGLYVSKIASKNIVKAVSANLKRKQKTVVVFTFEPNQFEIDLNQLVQKYENKIKFTNGIKPIITLEIESENERQILNDVTEFLKVN